MQTGLKAQLEYHKDAFVYVITVQATVNKNM
jgi:hypothetical protein